MTRTFKALSVLLTYPTAELQKAVPEIVAAIDRDAGGVRSRVDASDRRTGDAPGAAGGCPQRVNRVELRGVVHPGLTAAGE